LGYGLGFSERKIFEWAFAVEFLEGNNVLIFGLGNVGWVVVGMAIRNRSESYN